MNNTTVLFNEIKSKLAPQLQFLQDKPEETLASTIKACWLKAAGMPVSAEASLKHELPQLNETEIDILNNLLNRRLENVPLAHITGRQNFMGIELLSDPRALIPRKETELLGSKALEISLEYADQREQVRIMDICCGGGNLALAIAFHNPKAHVFAADLSGEAIALTLENINFLSLQERVEASQGDIFSCFENEKYFANTDIIVCNPPYISTAKVPKMHTETASHEPSLAFDGGMFGTNIIQKVIINAPRFLTPGGWLLMEVGAGQGEFIKRLCDGSESFLPATSVNDDHGNIRVIMAQKRY